MKTAKQAWKESNKVADKRENVDGLIAFVGREIDAAIQAGQSCVVIGRIRTIVSETAQADLFKELRDAGYYVTTDRKYATTAGWFYVSWDQTKKP